MFFRWNKRKKIYGNIKEAVPKTYPFAILASALADAVTYGMMPFDKEGNVSSFENHAGFVTYIENVGPETIIDYEKVSQFFFGKYGPELGIIPQIRLPGMEWFSVLATDKNVVSIGTTLAKSRSPQNPLRISSFFKRDPKALLLYTDRIPFKLIIDKPNLNFIIPMLLGGKVGYVFEEISARNTDQIINGFVRLIRTLNMKKTFYIKKLNDLHDVIILGPLGVVYYAIEGQIYIEILGEIEKREASEEEVKPYKDLLTVTQAYLELGKYRFVKPKLSWTDRFLNYLFGGGQSDRKFLKTEIQELEEVIGRGRKQKQLQANLIELHNHVSRLAQALGA